MSQLREKQKKAKDNSFVWTDDEVLLLLKVTLDYKTAKTMENIDWIDTVTSTYTKIYGYERPHVSGYTAYTEVSTLESEYRNLRIHRAYTADTCGRLVYPHKKICGYKNLLIRVDGALRFVLSKLPACSLDIRTVTHELIVK